MVDVLEEPLDRADPRDARGGLGGVAKELVVCLEDLSKSVHHQGIIRDGGNCRVLHRKHWRSLTLRILTGSKSAPDQHPRREEEEGEKVG